MAWNTLEQLNLLAEKCNKSGEGFIALYFPKDVNDVYVLAEVNDQQLVSGLYALCSEAQIDIDLLVGALLAIKQTGAVSKEDWPERLEASNG